MPIEMTGAMARSDLSRRFVRTLPWAAFEGATSVVSGLLTTFVIGRVLDATEVGRAGLAVSLVALVEIGSAAGIQEAVVRARSAHTSLTDTAFWASVIFSLVGITACGVLSPAIAYAFSDPTLVPLTMVASLSLLFNATIAVPSATLTRKMRAAALARRLAVGKLAALVSLVALALLHTGPWSIVVSYVTGSLAAAMLIAWTSARLPRLHLSLRELQPLLAFGGLFSLEAVLWTVALRVFGIIFGYFHGVAEYGAFQFALRLVDDLATLIQRTVLRFGLSYFSALTRSNGSTRKAFVSGSKLLTVLATPIFGGIALTAHDLIVVVFGAKWLVAVPMIQIVAASWLFGFPRSLVGPVLRAEGKQAVLVRYAAFTTAYMVAVAFLTGQMSAAVATAAFCLRQVFAVPWGLFVIRNEIGVSVREQLSSLQSGTIALLLMAVAIMLARFEMALLSPPNRLVVTVAVGASAYVAAVLCLDRGLRDAASAVGRKLARRSAGVSGTLRRAAWPWKARL